MRRLYALYSCILSSFGFPAYPFLLLTVTPDLQRIGELAKIFAIPVDALVELLSNPEEIERARPKSRPPKKVAAKPDSLGQLRPEEKSLIAIFRRCDPSSRQEIYQAAKEKLRS